MTNKAGSLGPSLDKEGGGAGERGVEGGDGGGGGGGGNSEGGGGEGGSVGGGSKGGGGGGGGQEPPCVKFASPFGIQKTTPSNVCVCELATGDAASEVLCNG